MSYFGLADGNYMNALFGSTNNKNNAGNLNFLGDYAAIRNGSYHKLLRSYYGANAKPDAPAQRPVQKPESEITVSKDDTKKLTGIQDQADKLKSVMDELYRTDAKSLFKQKEVEQEDGTIKKEYDTEAIYKKVSEFVDSYNGLLKSAEDVKSNSVSRAAGNMYVTTRLNSKLLGKIGIDVKEDGSLKLNKETFEKTDMARVKELFNGIGTFGYQLSSRVSMVDYTAEREASKANTYNRTGSYNNNYRYSYNSYI